MAKLGSSKAEAIETATAGAAPGSVPAHPSITPDQLVEEKILARLGQENLLDAQGIKAIRSKLASGELTTEDWNFALENALERRKRNG